MKKTEFAAIFIFVFLMLSGLQAQTGARDNKHRFYLYWGWNRGYYSNSDIHFTGKNYDFTLYDVTAKDRQTPFALDVYFHPSKLTIPQTNYGVGYYLHDRWLLSRAMDHMKYVVQQNETVRMSGKIENTGSGYDGVYASDAVEVKDGFLKLEHTDGLNYLFLELNRSDNLLKNLPGLNGKLEANLTEGFGAGVLLPRTDASLLSFERNNKYHLAGYGLSVSGGLQLVFYQHYFLRGVLKTGFIHLPSVRTTPAKVDKATQHFFFLEPVVQFGGMFYLKK